MKEKNGIKKRKRISGAKLRLIVKYFMHDVKKNFIRRREDFTCDHCGYNVAGDGYTDHCPNCLYGKHVDKDIPGDRKSSCKGLLLPIGIKIKNKKTQIGYKCQKCHRIFFCTVSKNDNQKKLEELYNNLL
jgi:ribosomal protein L37AE/L43A